jgi:ABC-type oligopeptide transport system substrate-binding subunit
MPPSAPALLLICISLATSACTKTIDNSRLRVDVIENDSNPLTIATVPLSYGSAHLRLATAQGLVAFDHEGRVSPGLAARWIVTDDGMSYIFRLQKTKWANGAEVTSDDVATTLNARIAQLRQSRLGSEISLIDRVVSMTGKVVEIRLKSPMPNLLELLAQPEFGIVLQGSGTGPMRAKHVGGDLVFHDLGRDARGRQLLRENSVTLRKSRAPLAIAMFKNGKSDLIIGGKYQDYPFVNAANTSDGTVQFDPVPGLFGLRFERAGPFLSKTENREAVAMALDRPKMLTAMDQIIWHEAVTLVPESMKNRGKVVRASWTSLRIADRKIQAKHAIEKWKSANGPIRPLQIAMPAGPGSKILFALIRADLRSIGLDAILVTGNSEADLRLIDRVADLSEPGWYLRQLSCKSTPICSTKADALVQEAEQNVDKALRMTLLADAEAQLQGARNFVPIASPLRWALVRDKLMGFSPNPRAWHPLQNLGKGSS